MKCDICGKEIVLSPSAEQRARKYGGKPSDYTRLFATHTKCALAKRGRRIPWSLCTESGAQTETQAPYNVGQSHDDQIINQALAILLSRALKGDLLNSPQAVRDYLRLKLGPLEHEEFAVAFLNSQNETIKFEVMFRGTLTQTSVYPREVVKAALKYNAAAIILAHNHPSGVLEPSYADRSLTDQLKAALGLVDVKVLDHFIVTLSGYVSFAEKGWI